MMKLEALRGSKAVAEEMDMLAKGLGTELRHKVNLWGIGDEPVMKDDMDGFAYEVKLLSHGIGWPGLARVASVSLILHLPQETKYYFSMQESKGMSLIFNTPAEPKHLDQGFLLQQSQVDEVLPAELRTFLTESGVDYFLNILRDRIVISVYRVYSHELYLFLFEQMKRAAQVLVSI